MNFYAISALINFLTSFILGVFVFLKNPRSSKNISFGLFALCAGWWSISYYLWQISTSQEVALFWVRSLMAGAIFITVTYLHFVFSLLDILNKRKLFLILSYFLFSIFFLFNFTSLFVSHVEQIMNFKFWPIAGPQFNIFLPIWLFYAFYAVYLLTVYYFKLKGVIRLQIRYLLIGTIIGYLGGITNYFLWYKIPIPPFGNISASFYLIIVAYAILKYRLMDIRIVIRRVFVYFISAGFAYGIFFLLAWFFEKQFGGVFNFPTYLSGLIIAPIFVGAFLWFNEIIQKFANKHFFYALYNYQTTINELSQRLNYLNDLGEIVNLIVDTVKQVMQLDKAGVLLVDQSSGIIHYKIAKVIGFNENNGISLVQDNFLTRYLEKTQKPLVREELFLLSKDSKEEESKKKFVELSQNMKKIEALLCIPLMSSKKLIGIIVLGSKISGDAYSKEDLELLNTLAYQAGIAVDNARLYKEIQDLNENLQQKVDEQTKEIKRALEVEKKANEELKRLDVEKTMFMNATSHHLRTPLTSIRGFTDLAMGGTFGKLTKTLKDTFSKINSSGKILENMISEFMDVSSLGLGKSVSRVEPEVDFEKILDKVLEDIGKVIETDIRKQRGWDIYFKVEKPREELPKIKADPLKLKMALFNIINNGVKYTDKGGVIVSIKKENNKILVIVKDTGIGITKEELETIFTRTYSQSQRAHGAYPYGRGIGLYFSTSVIKEHGGKVWAESEGEGKGSTFFIELPI